MTAPEPGTVTLDTTALGEARSYYATNPVARQAAIHAGIAYSTYLSEGDDAAATYFSYLGGLAEEHGQVFADTVIAYINYLAASGASAYAAAVAAAATPAPEVDASTPPEPTADEVAAADAPAPAVDADPTTTIVVDPKGGDAIVVEGAHDDPPAPTGPSY